MSPDALSTVWLLQSDPVRGGLTSTDPVQLTAQLLGIGIAAATAAGLVALAYRWYVRERVPTGLGVLFGLTVVAVSLGTTGALGAVIAQQNGVLESSYVLPNLAAFAIGAAGSSVGIRAGDAVATDVFATTSRAVDADVSEIVQTVGRVTAVKLPAEIDDIVGYDPVPDATKETLAGRRFLFPRRLTKSELRDRLVARLKTDYGVGHVDVELGDDGAVDYIAVGSRAAGIGPTLPPATNAVAIRADPANAASSGDLVQVWQDNPLERVLTGELRGVAGDVVTVAIDAGDTPKLDPTRQYKLVTLPVQDRPDREFASLLRAADETMETITVAPGSELVGTTVGELRVTVAAITREDSPPVPIPSRDRVLEAGDVVYAIAKPDALRYAEGAATRQRESPVGSDHGDEQVPAEQSSDTASGSVAEEPVDTSDEGQPAENGEQAGETTDDGPAAEADAAPTESESGDEEKEPGDESSAPADEESELTGEDGTSGDGDSAPAPESEPAPDIAEAEPSDSTATGSPDDGDGTGSTAADDSDTGTDADETEPAVDEASESSAGEETVTVWDPDEKLGDEDALQDNADGDDATADDADEGGDAEPPSGDSAGAGDTTEDDGDGDDTPEDDDEDGLLGATDDDPLKSGFITDDSDDTERE